MSNRNNLEIVQFTKEAIESPNCEMLASLMQTNEIPDTLGWSVYILIQKQGVLIRRLIFDGLASKHNAQAWILSTFQKRTYDETCIENPVEHFSKNKRLFAQKDGTFF